MSFSYPEYAAPLAMLGAVLTVLAAISWLVARRRSVRLLGSARFVRRGAFASDLVLLAAFAAIGAALLGPELGLRTLRVAGSGADVVFLVDVSASMDAADVPPSRLARARELAGAVLTRLAPEDRAALAVFADRGVLLAPLTPDMDALGELVAALDGELALPRGSDLSAGVAAALGAFDPASERPRVVLALSDGEDADARESGSPLARRARARVVTVALGTESGAELPVADPPVVSRRDAARLAALAAATGGIALRADRWGDVDLAALVAALRRDAMRASDGTAERRVPADRAAAVAAIAFVLLALEGIGLHRSFGPTAKRARFALGTTAALTIASLASATAPGDAIAWLEARLRDHPAEARSLVALGVARAEDGRLDEAAHALRAAAIGAERAEEAAIAYYDLGLVEVRRKRFEAARAAFLDALALAPEDTEARFNLEWTARTIAAEPPESAAAQEDPPAPDGSQPDTAAPPPPTAGELPQPAPRPDAGRGFAPELSPDRVEQWLESIGDDPSRGLRGAAGAPDSRRPSRAAAARW